VRQHEIVALRPRQAALAKAGESIRGDLRHGPDALHADAVAQLGAGAPGRAGGEQADVVFPRASSVAGERRGP
jgi:hypothetical protein